MSISLTRILQQITGLNTFFAGPSASRDNGVVLLDTATVTWGTDGQGNIQATAGGTLPTATGAGQVLTSTGAGTTYTAQALPVGSASQGGIVKVDGTTITANAGVISTAATVALNTVGTQITAASTIAPTSTVHHITGATVVETITAPAGVTAGWTLILIPDDASGQATGTSGNIALASTMVQHKALHLTYDGTNFYPSY
jgi:hypothetical protein